MTHDNGAHVKWESTTGPGQLANEPGSGARLIIECAEFGSQLRNKEAVLGLARQLVAAPNEAVLREALTTMRLIADQALGEPDAR